MSIELSAAILIVGGLIGAVGTVGLAAGIAVDGVGGDAVPPWAGVVLVLPAAFNVLTVVVGVLVRRGAAWILCVNVVAIVLFIELTAVPSGRATALALAALDAFVFVALLRNRAWFDWRAPVEGSRR